MASFQPHRAKNFHAIDFLCFVFLQASPIENVPGKAERLGAVRAWISPPYYVGSPDSRQTFHQGIKTVANYSSVRHSSEWEALSVVWSIGPNPHFSLSSPSRSLVCHGRPWKSIDYIVSADPSSITCGVPNEILVTFRSWDGRWLIFNTSKTDAGRARPASPAAQGTAESRAALFAEEAWAAGPVRPVQPDE